MGASTNRKRHAPRAAAPPAGGPTHAMIELVSRAKALHRSGQLADAEQAYRQALAADPDDAQALHFLGLLHHQQGNGAAAVDLMYRAVAASPRSPEFHCNLGMVLGQAGRTQEALEVLDRALELKADYPEAHDNRGVVLEQLGKADEAIIAWQRAVELRPEFPTAHYHLATTLLAKGRAPEALEHARRAVRLHPRYAEAHNALGCALRAEGKLEEAAAAFRTAAQIQPGLIEPQLNLGALLMELGRPHEAVPHLEKCVELKPELPDAHWTLAFALLACGEFDRGWLEYEWRRYWPVEGTRPPEPVEPPWYGCNLAGRTLLLVSEQGLGDTLQFIRYAPLLAARGANVIVQCQPELRDLLRGVRGIAQIITRNEPRPRFDTHAALLSVPGILGTRLGNIPGEVPYLHADAAREAMWKPRLAGPGFKVGVAWQGSPTFLKDGARSIPLSAFAPLAAIEGVRLLSLQKNAGTEQIKDVASSFRVEEIDPPLDEGTGAFMDTAAVMMHLDLVVTSDTAVAHLAGALGVRVWLALGVGCDWRWLLGRDDSPWYPTMRLFRQQEPGDWAGVFARMAVALRDTLGARTPEDAPPILAPMAPGELLDRLTILQIKSQRLTDPAKLRTTRVELESLSRVREASLPQGEQLDALVRELRGVNETLWQVEDDIRAAEGSGDFGAKFVELARSVYRTNDRRAELKRRINVLLGSATRDEKQYANSGAGRGPGAAWPDERPTGGELG